MAADSGTGPPTNTNAGCGCQSAALVPWLFAALPLLALRRRRVY
jgi:hypothetical protein